ncbi:glycosyltransferase [Granulosicoccus antarcticus]|uniref:Glycosyltransferase EpsF n=1 Tax=Granulosicoccus antarcticus IMCC3135 TaxID=1192854 RepID=A0A2Z2NMT1_9GAMM|nr:glycosyltransferase [Granulosicoccus antarcticus]ASJ71038.1 Putative glycosyltransferase EpsF [Granulosicoccus antarcticus IMCC3135]
MLTEDRPEPCTQHVSPRASIISESRKPAGVRKAARSQESSDLPDNVSYLQTPRRLMFVIEALTVGGAEHMVVDLANEFVKRGDVVHVVCLSSLGELSSRLSPDVFVHLLNKKRGIDYKIPGRLRALAKKHRVQVVNSHLWTANLWTRIALVRSGIPVVVTEHNRDVWKKLHNRIADRALSRVTAQLIAVSQDTANFYAEDVGVDGKLISVVNNGVDTSLYASGNGAALRSELAAPGEFLIGTVGRLATAKNHPRLVEAAAIMRDAGVSVRVVIVGEGPQRDTTEACIADLNIGDRVTLLGERSDVPDLLAAFDVFVLSSDREGHPLSALEAQAAGTPVVLTDAGGSADAVSRNEHGVGGLLVEKSAEALAECLSALAVDPQRLQEMSAFAQSHASHHFDKTLMIDRYSEIFDKVKRNSIIANK